jgi:hypothetical protein
MRSGLVRTNSSPYFLDYPGLLAFFVEIMSDKVILDQKKSYLVYLEIFFSGLIQFLDRTCPDFDDY